MQFEEFVRIDQIARDAEAEQVAANIANDALRKQKLVDTVTALTGSMTQGQKNQILSSPIIDNPNSIKVEGQMILLCPQFGLGFDTVAEPSKQATAVIGPATFMARDAGVAGNGLLVMVRMETLPLGSKALDGKKTYTPSGAPGGPQEPHVLLYVRPPTVDADYLVEIVVGGEPGVARFTISINGAPPDPPVTMPIGGYYPEVDFDSPYDGFILAFALAPPELGTPEPFVAGTQYSFALKPAFEIEISRGELTESWGAPVASDKVQARAKASLLLSDATVSGTLANGDAGLAGGIGGAVAALSGRLTNASRLPGLSAETRKLVKLVQAALAQ